jgi:hypothetical protein
MKNSKFTEEQIAFTLKQAELGTSVKEVIRKVRDHRVDLLPVEENI